MGKFGNKSIPKFMKDENDMPIGEDSATIHELQEGHSEPEIISLGDADGGDFITITVKTVEGEEVALDFKMDDEKEETDEEGVYKGTLSAEHNDVVYTINCEIEEAGDGDYDIKIGDVTADMNAPEMDDDSEQMNEARVMRFGQFISESWDVTDAYEGGESECCGAPILMGGICSDCKEHTEPMETDDADDSPFFPHEPMNEGAGCSDNAKMVIESMCNDHLVKEAVDYHEDEDDAHTYEGYVQACMEYLKECMMKEGWR
jgi:hypothetical protein